MYPVVGPWSLFSRLRILAGGQVIEDTDSYPMVHEMTNVSSATESKPNDCVSDVAGF